MRAKTPGVVHAIHLSTHEETAIRVRDRRGRLPPPTLKAFEKLLRSQGNLTHPIEPRLISLVGIVSNHFGSRKLEVVSGFRPYMATQYTAHSNHNVGKAIDFRVAGVPNEVLRDYCRTLKKVGVGFYPNSTFVHLDVRATSAFWIDYSHPGEPPHYNSPNLEPDESASDVGDEAHLSADHEILEETTAPPPSPPQLAPTPAVKQDNGTQGATSVASPAPIGTGLSPAPPGSEATTNSR